MSLLNPVFAHENVRYRDGKRYAWFVSLLVPTVLGCGPLFYVLTDSVASLFMPALLVYGAIPLLDLLLGEDRNNPPEEVVPLLEADAYYRWATYALVPVLWLAFLGNADFVGTRSLPWFGVLAIALNTGILCGFAINLGHELGHKKSKLERNLATAVLSMGAYGHFAIEHYGLLRQKRANGLYERCQPHHSWNSNHACSNWATYHLQRHSDHHANPGRRYQSLRHFDGLPTLPNGYFGMFLVALVPSLWFRVMDPLLLAHTQGSPERINFDPRRRAALCARYGLEDAQALEETGAATRAAA